MPTLPKIIAIVGPTGSGKSDLALVLAKEFDGEIIAADSRTIYKGMNIGTAKPPRDMEVERTHTSIKDLFNERPYLVQGIAHWGFDLVEPNDAYDVSTFAQYARKKIEEITQRGHMPIVVGGSGLYAQAIIDNPTFSDVKPDQARRAELNAMSLVQLQARLQEIDPEAYELIDTENPRRLVRAIEVVEATGKPWAAQQQKGDPYVEALQIGFEIDREDLYARLDTRVDSMVAHGLVDEARKLKEKYGSEAPGLTGIGYRQLTAFFDGYIKLRDAIELLKRDTRHYAKRQLTWFKRDARIHWILTANDARVLVEKFL